MRQVTRFESNLLKILHAVLGRVPAAHVLKPLTQTWRRPPCLSRDCVDLVQDTLAKGCTYYLATGGWRDERFLRGEDAAGGRLWQRTPPAELGLEFSAFTLDFLIWLTEANVSKESVWQPFEEESLTLGDRLVLAMTFDAVSATEIGAYWATSETFSGDGLCVLMHPEQIAKSESDFTPDFEPWLSPEGQYVLEALQRHLATAWMALETAKGTIISHQRMSALGQTQRKTLETFFAAVEAVGRRDLARWLLIAAEKVLTGAPSADHWIGGVDVRGLRVSQRTEVYRAAVALLASLDQLSTWQQEALNTGYFDEGYAASQLWKSDWEAYNGDTFLAAAEEIVRQAEPLGM